jgi:lipoic acid synthetase
MMREKGMHTVCEEAACPNIGECWQRRHAAFMILGDPAPAPAPFATSRRTPRRGGPGDPPTSRKAW